MQQEGCQGVFVDVGANGGDTVLNWFRVNSCSEPGSTWPCLPSLPAWLTLEKRRSYCAEVFEANPRHWARLNSTATTLQQNVGRQVRFHPRAFAIEDGQVQFGLDNATRDGQGSSLIMSKRMRDTKTGKVGRGAEVRSNSISVLATDGVDFLREVGRANLPVTLKVDVEGFEFELLRELLVSGVLCNHVNELFIEWHEGRFDWHSAALPVQAKHWDATHLARAPHPLTLPLRAAHSGEYIAGIVRMDAALQQDNGRAGC